MPSWSLVQATAGAAAGVLSLAAFAPYALSAIRNPNKRPHRATWCIWTLVGILLAIGNYSNGVRAGIWLPLSFILGPALLAIISLKHGEGGWSLLDRFCITGALVSAGIWWMTDDPFLMLLINIGIDALGAIPTIKKSYHEPEAEDPIFWYLASAATALNLVAIETWSVAAAVYPVYMFLLMGTISLFELRPSWRRRSG